MHIRWNIEQSETRRMWKKYNIDAKWSEAGIFLKNKNKGPKIHYFALKLYTGASKTVQLGLQIWGSGAPGPPGPPPGSASVAYWVQRVRGCQAWAHVCTFTLSILVPMQWRIQDFPEEGAPTYYLANFSRKLHENEEILSRGGHVSLAPSLRSATAMSYALMPMSHAFVPCLVHLCHCLAYMSHNLGRLGNSRVDV